VLLVKANTGISYTNGSVKDLKAWREHNKDPLDKEQSDQIKQILSSLDKIIKEGTPNCATHFCNDRKIKEEVKELNGVVETAVSDVNGLKTDVGALTTDVANIKTKLETMSSTLDTINTTFKKATDYALKISLGAGGIYALSFLSMDKITFIFKMIKDFLH
jgi:regulator of replication initiation timing